MPHEHENMDQIVRDMTRLLRAAHDLGVRDATARIVAAVTADSTRPPAGLSGSFHSNTFVGTHETVKRAPRGLLPATLKSILRETPGLTGTEMENAVTDRAPEVSRNSVVNELRRQEGRFYRRENGRWYLMEAQMAD